MTLGTRERTIVEVLYTCQRCRKLGKTHIHHKDGDHYNDEPSNRVRLCPSCHKKAHIDMLVAKGQRLSPQHLSERLPYGYEFPLLPFDEVRAQYQKCFPRA